MLLLLLLPIRAVAVIRITNRALDVRRRRLRKVMIVHPVSITAPIDGEYEAGSRQTVSASVPALEKEGKNEPQVSTPKKNTLPWRERLKNWISNWKESWKESRKNTVAALLGVLLGIVAIGILIASGFCAGAQGLLADNGGWMNAVGAGVVATGGVYQCLGYGGKSRGMSQLGAGCLVFGGILVALGAYGALYVREG